MEFEAIDPGFLGTASRRDSVETSRREAAPALSWDVRELDRVSPFSFGIYVSKIKETMTLEDPETTIERLYHEMYGSLPV